jgi:hypothetical protein
MNTRTIAVGISILTSLLTFSSLPIAYADAEQAIAQSTSDLIAQVAPDAGDVITPIQSGTSMVASIADTIITVPSNPEAQITMQSVNPDVLVIVEISLPEETIVKNPRVEKDGTIVYTSSSKNGAHAAIQVLEDGSLRMQTIMDSAKGPHKFSYNFGKATPVIQADGSVLIIQSLDKGSVLFQAVIAKIEPAWAVDADGKPVNTRYVVNGNKHLVQVIDVDKDTKYPVVADPTVSIAWDGISIYFNRSETSRIGSNAVGWATLAISVGGLAWGPAGYLSIYVGAVNLTASSAYSRGQCLRMLFGTLTWVWVPTSYSGGNCK